MKRQLCLQLDVGNSSAKWRLVDDGSVTARGSYRPDDADSLALLLNCTARLDHIWIASVAAADTEQKLAQLLAAQWHVTPWFARSEAVTGNLRNSYTQPGRMGVDRWLAMVGARARSKDRLCVIDAGSALTIDLVSATGQHEGGYIIPWPSLMERALLLDTDRVRFDEATEYALVPGVSTAQAVRHGIALAQAGAVTLALAQAAAPPPSVFYCGGAGQLLMRLVDREGQWAPDLVFEGLEVMAASAL